MGQDQDNKADVIRKQFVVNYACVPPEAHQLTRMANQLSVRAKPLFSALGVDIKGTIFRHRQQKFLLFSHKTYGLEKENHFSQW